MTTHQSVGLEEEVHPIQDKEGILLNHESKDKLQLSRASAAEI